MSCSELENDLNRAFIACAGVVVKDDILGSGRNRDGFHYLTRDVESKDIRVVRSQHRVTSLRHSIFELIGAGSSRSSRAIGVGDRCANAPGNDVPLALIANANHDRFVGGPRIVQRIWIDRGFLNHQVACSDLN